MTFNPKVIASGFKIASKAIIKHAPTIATVFGVCLMGGSTVQAIIVAPKAKDDLDVLEAAEGVAPKEYIKGKAKIIVHHYWPVAVMSLAGAGFIFWSHKATLAQTAAAIAAYNMKAEDLEKLEQKVIATDGEKHLEKMRDDIAKDNALATPFNNETVINTGHGNMLLYDAIGKRYFLSDLEFIRQSAEQFNFDMANQGRRGREMMASLNDWYDQIGLENLDGRVDGKKLGPPIGDRLGWRNKLMRLRFTSVLLPNNDHCTVMGFADDGAPMWDFDIDPDECKDYDRYDSSDWRDRH